MGIARDVTEAAGKLSNPAIGFVSPPGDAKLLSGEPISADGVDLTARMLARGSACTDAPSRAAPWGVPGSSDEATR